MNSYESDILHTFGRRLRALRQQRGLSQEEFADQARLHRTYIGAIERGEQNISLRNIAKLAQTLEVSITELFVSEEHI